MINVRSVSFLRIKAMVYDRSVIDYFHYTCGGLNLSLVKTFFNWFQFYFLLFQSMVRDKYTTKENKN